MVKRISFFYVKDGNSNFIIRQCNSAVFNLVNEMRFSFKNGSGLDRMSTQMSVGHGFGNCFNNWGRGGHNRGVVIVGGGVIVRGSSDQRDGSSLNLIRFSSFDRGSRGNIRNIGVVSVGVVVVAIIASIVVIEPIVSVVVRVVAIVVVGSVVSISLSLGFGFSLGLGVS